MTRLTLWFLLDSGWLLNSEIRIQKKALFLAVKKSGSPSMEIQELLLWCMILCFCSCKLFYPTLKVISEKLFCHLLLVLLSTICSKKVHVLGNTYCFIHFNTCLQKNAKILLHRICAEHSL